MEIKINLKHWIYSVQNKEEEENRDSFSPRIGNLKTNFKGKRKKIQDRNQNTDKKYKYKIGRTIELPE